MLSSTYDILELFEKAFQSARSVSGLANIDCSGKTRWAEGTKNGVDWRIEADILNPSPTNKAQLQTGYKHLGDALLPQFYRAAHEKVKGLGWTGSDIDKHVHSAMIPVILAMKFNMGVAADRGWLDESTSMSSTGQYLQKNADFSLGQATQWTSLGKPGRWTSMELMAMLISLDRKNRFMDEATGTLWVASHKKEHQGVALQILETVFSSDANGKHRIQVDAERAVQAWKSWWMQMPTMPLADTLLSQLQFFALDKSCCLVEGWYLRVAQSKELGRHSIVRMGRENNGFSSQRAWQEFANGLAMSVASHPTLAWKDVDSQAWLLNAAFQDQERADQDMVARLPFLKANRVTEYLSVSGNLNPGQKVHELFPLWCHMQARPLEQTISIDGLFDDAGVQPVN